MDAKCRMPRDMWEGGMDAKCRMSCDIWEGGMENKCTDMHVRVLDGLSSAYVMSFYIDRHSPIFHVYKVLFI